MAEEEVTGVLYRVKVDIAALEQLKDGLRQAGQVGTQEIGQVLPDASEKAGKSFRLFGAGTRQLRAVLAATGDEGGKMASTFIQLSYALETGLSTASLVTIGITALVGTVALLATKMSEVSDSTAFNKFLDESKEKVKALREEATRLNKALDPRGPGEQGLSETRKALGRLRGELEAIEQRRAKANKEVSLPGAEDSTDTYYDKQKNKLNSQIIELEAAERDYLEVTEKELAASLVIRMAAQQRHGEQMLAEIKKQHEEQKRAQKSGEWDRAGVMGEKMPGVWSSIEANFEQTKSELADIDVVLKSAAKREEAIARGHAAVLASIDKKSWKDKKKNRQQDLESQKEDEDKRREAVKQWIDVAQAGMESTIQVAAMFDLFGEKSAKNEEERARAVGMRLGFENMIMAATETARAVSSWPDAPSMVMHGIGAALHTAAMVKCFADPAAAGGFSSPSSGGAGGSAAAHGAQMARDAADKREAKESGGVVINIYGNQINAEGADRLFAEGAARWAKKQKPNSTTGRL